MASDQLIHFHTMSSPNTNTLMTLLTDTVRGNHKPTAAGFKIVYIGKDKTPLSILEIAPIEGNAWENQPHLRFYPPLFVGKWKCIVLLT